MSGTQRRANTNTVPKQPPRQEDFPPLPQSTPPLLPQQPIPPTTSSTRPASPPLPQPQPFQIPRGVFLITADAIRTLTRELSRSIDTTVTQADCVTLDTKAFESTASAIGDKIVHADDRENAPSPSNPHCSGPATISYLSSFPDRSHGHPATLVDPTSHSLRF